MTIQENLIPVGYYPSKLYDSSRISKYEDLYWGDFSFGPDESFDSPAWMELTHLWFSDIFRRYRKGTLAWNG